MGAGYTTSYGDFFDLNSIPPAVIERVEVLPVGASAIYGADALGGAVNIILRKDLNGVEVNGKLAHTKDADGEDSDVNLAWGKNLEPRCGGALYYLSKLAELNSSHRELTSSLIFRRMLRRFNYIF